MQHLKMCLYLQHCINKYSRDAKFCVSYKATINMTELTQQSDRFKTIYVKLREIIMKEFPNATEGIMYDMHGFRERITREDIADWPGTMDPNYLYVGLVERKAGITLHIWNPSNYYGLDRIRKDYEKAGFKVMRGCLQWNKKAEYPIEMIEDLIKNITQEINK